MLVSDSVQILRRQCCLEWLQDRTESKFPILRNTLPSILAVSDGEVKHFTFNFSVIIRRKVFLEHEGRTAEFSMKQTNVFGGCLVRQVNEAVRIEMSTADCVMNSKSEFHQAPLVRVVPVNGLVEEQGAGVDPRQPGGGRDRGAGGGGRGRGRRGPGN